MKTLTKAEEEVMNILWNLEKAFVRDILDEYKESKPAYNTISTIIRILEEKGFVKHESFGRSHRYFPAIDKIAYKKYYMKNVLGRFFDNSYKNLVSFFSSSDDLSIEELEEIKELIDKKIENKK